MLRGCDKILECLCKKLNIQPGETSADKEFTVVASECLGACDRAPMMLVNETVVGPVEEKQLDGILQEAKKSKGYFHG
jgi:NADH-quinone oxidoreductase subunit E